MTARLVAGTLRSVAEIQLNATTRDALGQPTQAWVTIATVRADVRYLSGLETIKADAETSVVKASIRIRYRTDLTAGMRVVVGARVFEIKAVLPDEQWRDKVDLACEVVDA